MQLSSNRVYEGWRRKWSSLADAYQTFEPDVAVRIRRTDIVGAIGELETLPANSIRNDATSVAAFCYAVAGEQCEASDELPGRAARVLQRLAISQLVPRDVAEYLVEAAQRFPLDDDLERYHVQRSIAANAVPGSNAQEAARRRQFEMAQGLVGASPEHRPRLAECHIDAAGDEQGSGDLLAARTSLEEAIKLCEQPQGARDPRNAVVTGRAHSRMGDVLRELHDKAGARSHFERAMDVLEACTEETQASELATLVTHVLTQLSELVQERGDHSAAQRHLEVALDLVDRGVIPGWARWDLLRRICSVLTACKRKAGARQLLDEILANYGIEAAAIAGHRAADQVWSVCRASQLAQHGEAQDGVSAQDRLIQLLNLGRQVVDRRVADVDPAKGPYGGTEWERWRCVQVMQRLAAMVVAAKDGSGDEREIVRSGRCARFRGFRIEDVEGLSGLVDRVYTGADDEDPFRTWTPFVATAGPPGDDSIVWDLEVPTEDYYNDYKGESGEVDLVLCHDVETEGDVTPLDLWVMRGLELLLGAALYGQPDLRRCQMPRGVYRELDYQLGKRDAPPPKCNRFFIPTKGHKDTCGHPTCETYHGRLQPLGIKLMQRAEELAARECRADGSLEDFHEMWREASTNRDARAALARFSRMLKSASKSRNSS